MTKRRRERDKPKSGPEALYNPNKRVLLSYASDEEEAAEDVLQQPPPVNAAEAAVDDRALANYQMDEYPDSEGDAAMGAEVGLGVDAYERKDERANQDAEDETLSAAQHTASDDWGPPTKRDISTNQWPSLGPVSYGEDDEDEEYDPETEEAMAYLRAVRSERQTIPEIISAPRPLRADADHLQDTNHRNSNEPDLEDDDSDGAGVSIQVEPISRPAEDDATNPQKVFTRLLVERFMEQHKQLHLPPSMDKLAELPDSCPISFPQGNSKAFAEWNRLISTKAPLPAQLRSMEQDSILNLIGLVEKQYLAKTCNLSKVTSAWIWSLLARLDEVGTMTNDEVFMIRELGKRAVFWLVSFTSPELAAGLESLEEAPSLASTQSEHTLAIPPPENTLATLDMILVVVGEVFGQKDLLEFRPTWSAIAKPV